MNETEQYLFFTFDCVTRKINTFKNETEPYP
jgi:hypothetical protein